MAAAVAGHGGLALVGGEPGIGKTRLAEEVARRARDAGVRVLWSSCWQDHGAPPFWPWIQLLREHARERDPADLRAELGPDAGEIGRLVPELVGRQVQPQPDGGGARLRLFDGVAAFLRRAASTSPLLLVVEDLHWADTGSLLLLRFLASGLRGSPLLVLSTYRDVEARTALEALLSTLAATREHLVLEGLTAAEVAELMGQLSGTRPQPEQASSMHRRTNGNPLFVRELVRLPADPCGADGRLPEGVREVVQRRLDRLSAPCSQLLAAAAVIGERFRLDLLQAVSGLEDEVLAGLIEEAVAAHLVEEVAGAAPAHRFTRALVQEVLYQGLASGRRRQLHHRVGRAIEELHGHDLEPRPAELARHFRLAGDHGDRVRAVQYATLAGRTAMRLLVFEEAAAHFVSALEMLGANRPANPESCELLPLLARALKAAGEVAAARAAYERAADLARSLGAAGPLAEAALGIGTGTTVGVVDDVEIHLLERALDAVGDDDAVRARLLARLARALHSTTSLERRRGLGDAAVAIARRVGDPPTLAAVLLDHCVIISSSASPEDALAVSGEVIHLADRMGDDELSLRARRMRIGNLLELGEVEAVRAELEISDRMARELRRPEHRWHGPLVRSGLATIAGRFEEAEELAHMGLRLGRIAQEPGIAVYHQALIVFVRHLQGRLPQLASQLTDQVARYPAVADWRCVLALALAAAGRHEDARRELEMAAADDVAVLSRQHSTRYSLAMLALACDALGDRRRAEALHPLLAPHAAYFVQLGRSGTGCLGSMAHYLGVVCCTLSRWKEEAVRHLETAIEMNSGIGAAALVAGSRFECARALRAVGGAAAEARAAEHLDRAREAATALGLGAPRTTAVSGPPLSRREREVAELVAAGLSNAEIAERLVISKRTAENHVDHIRQKLGMASRAGIISWSSPAAAGTWTPAAESPEIRVYAGAGVAALDAFGPETRRPVAW
jgi:DNA-binding CsgD family transcriptional regulator/tetratricopeptide (TPR) repeat protein